MKKIQVGFLMSYDYELLKKSIPPVYEEADSIFIALDKDQKTWTGTRFEIDPDFFSWLESFDTSKKIIIYKDCFYDPNLDPMENEVRERTMLGIKMGVGNWLIQIDSDEYFVNFKEFVNDLRSKDVYLEHPEKNQVQIAGFYINLYKYVEDGILYVDESRNQKFATNFPSYRTGRNTRKRVIYTKNLVLHECLSRTEEEIRTKFENWGHAHQVKYNDFIDKWRKVNKDNYNEHQDFFYLEPEKWKSLDYVRGHSISEISKNLNYSSLMPSDLFIWKKNFGQWFKFLMK